MSNYSPTGLKGGGQGIDCSGSVNTTL